MHSFQLFFNTILLCFFTSGEGLIGISAAYFLNNIGTQNKSYLAIDVTGRNILYMAGEAVVYFGIVLLTESSMLKRILYFIDEKKTSASQYASDMSISANEKGIEHGSTAAPRVVEGQDDDVELEKEKTHDIATNAQLLHEYPLVLNSIKKTYPNSLFSILFGNSKPKCAVREINLACGNGERFGLLGINGAVTP